MPRMTPAQLQAFEARRAARSSPSTSEGDQEMSRGTEYDLHTKIFAECRRRGWIALHGAMSESTHRTLGEWDFTVVADHSRVFFIECKSASGKLRPAQAALIAQARKLGHQVHVVRSFLEFLTTTTTNEHANPTPHNQGGLPP